MGCLAILARTGYWRPCVPSQDRLWPHFIGNAQRGVLLNLAGLNRNPCNVEPRIFCDLNEVEFRGVALTRDHSKGAPHGSMRCILSRDAQASAGARAIHTDVVPSGTSDHRIEHTSREFFNMRPAIAERLPNRIQITREDATTA